MMALLHCHTTVSKADKDFLSALLLLMALKGHSIFLQVLFTAGAGLFSSTSNPNRLTSVKDIAGSGGSLPPACSLMHDGGASPMHREFGIPSNMILVAQFAHQLNQEEYGKTAKPFTISETEHLLSSNKQCLDMENPCIVWV